MVVKRLKDYPEYSNYNNMKTRCYNPNRKYWYLYGGRGIKVCDEWRYDFYTFYKDMGPKPSPIHSIDRIDPNKDYCKDNCRWALPSEQSKTKRKPIQIYCINCGKQDHGKMRKGLCHACNEYYRRNGYHRDTNPEIIKQKLSNKLSDKLSISIVQLSLDNQFIKKWKNMIIASKELNISKTGISNCLSKRTKTSGNFKWMYFQDYHDKIHDELSAEEAIALNLKDFNNESIN